MSGTQPTMMSFFSRKNADNNPTSNAAGDQSLETESEDEMQEAEVEIEEEHTEEPQRKRPKHKFIEAWKNNRPWLNFKDELMFCNWCISSNKKNALTSGCNNLRTSTLDRHCLSADHKQAIQDQKLRIEMTESAKKARSLREDSIVRAIQTTYWMGKEDISSMKYASMLDFLDFQGVDVKSMSVGQNATYKSRAAIYDFQVGVIIVSLGIFISELLC